MDKNNLMMLKIMHEVEDKVLGMVEGLLNLGMFPLRVEVVMGVEGKYAGRLKWDIMSKIPM